MKSKAVDWVTSITLVCAIWSLIISVITFSQSFQLFEMETKEKIQISIYGNEIKSLNFIYDDAGERIVECVLNITIRFANESKLPIYIGGWQIYKSYNDISTNDIFALAPFDSQIEELDVPIYIAPQEVKQAECIFRIKVPTEISRYVVEKFSDVEELNIYDIQDYLLLGRHIDLWGNEIRVIREDELEKIEYQCEPFRIYFYSTRGNDFYAEYFTNLYISDQTKEKLNREIEYIYISYNKTENNRKKWLEEHFEMILFIVIMIALTMFLIHKSINNRNEK